MSDEQHKNGPYVVPRESPVAVRKPLGKTAFQELDGGERVGSALRILSENQIAFCTRLDAMDHDLVALGISVIHGMIALEEKINNLLQVSLPPMRRQEDSSVAITERARKAGEEARSDVQRIVEDPNTDLTPDTVSELIEAKVAKALQEQREQDRIRKLEADAKTAEDKRLADIEQTKIDKKTRSDRVWSIVSGVIVGLLLLAATAYMTYIQGHQRGHDEGHTEGFAEGAKTAPVIPIPVLVPEIESAVPTATAPASVATPHHH